MKFIKVALFILCAILLFLALNKYLRENNIEPFPVGNQPLFQTQTPITLFTISPTQIVSETHQPNANFFDTTEALPFPENGVYSSKLSDETVAPLTLNTPNGNDGYLVLFKNINTDDYIQLFVNPGQSYKITVPLGEYEMFWTYGNYWFGFKHRYPFGRSASAFRADNAFLFYKEDDYFYGHTFTFDSPQGTVQSTEIDPSLMSVDEEVQGE